MPDVARSPTLTIETTNAAQEAVVVTGVYAGYIYGNALVEVAVGRRTVKLPLLELEDAVRLPFVLGIGESATWTANLYQLREQPEEKQLTLYPHSRFLDFNRFDRERWVSYGRPAIMLRNRIARLSSRRLAVVVRDDQGAPHKAKVRWEPPGGRPPRRSHTRPSTS